MGRRQRKRSGAQRAAGVPLEQEGCTAAGAEFSGGSRWWWLALLLLVFLLGCYPLTDGDIWWHLRTGQLIWQRGEIPRTDWYTYTNPDAPWIDLHWGFQLPAAALWTLGGPAALILAKCATGTAAVAVALTIGRRSWSRWVTVACWLAPVLVLAGRYYVRPEMISLLLLASVLAVLYHGRSYRRLLFLLPLLQIVWVNIQGLFVLQFVVLSCWLFERVVRRYWHWGQDPEDRALPEHWPIWFTTAVLTLSAALVNPYGVEGAMFPYTLFQRVEGSERAFYHQFSGELSGTDVFVQQYGWSTLLTNLTTSMMLVILIGGMITFVLLLLYRRFSIYRLLIFVAFAYLAWQMTRNSVLFAIVGGVVLRTNVGQLGEVLWQRRQHLLRPELIRLSKWVTAAALVLLIVSVPSGLYHLLRPAVPPRHFGFDQSRWYGHRAARFVGSHPTPDYIYAAHEGQASVCIFHLGPQKRVFADPRLETNTKETLSRYLEIRQQLAAADPAAVENLLQGIPPGPDGRRPLPVLFLDNRTLIYSSLQQPGLLQGILASGLWRCVYCEPHVTFEQLATQPAMLLEGATVFIAEPQAAAANLPADPNLAVFQTLLGIQKDEG